jgi:hypothetical protein
MRVADKLILLPRKHERQKKIKKNDIQFRVFVVIFTILSEKAKISVLGH